MNKPHLERALDYMDEYEYARFKCTIGQADPGVSVNKKHRPEEFGPLVTRRLNELIQQEDNQAMKAFGEKLKTALEDLDHKVVKLKAPGL
jgi:hypothetical protein